MRFELRKSVALVGMMGSGKTAVGSALARLVDAPFLDSDSALEEAANMTIAEIFHRDGEAFFRDRESQVLRRLLDGQPGILSTGGGAFLSAANRRLISQRGVSVWLRAGEDLLWQRVRHKATRPLLRTADPRRTLRELCEARNPLYAQADLTVDADAKFSIEEMAGHVLAALASRPDVIERQDR